MIRPKLQIRGVTQDELYNWNKASNSWHKRKMPDMKPTLARYVRHLLERFKFVGFEMESGYEYVQVSSYTGDNITGDFPKSKRSKAVRKFINKKVKNER